MAFLHIYRVVYSRLLCDASIWLTTGFTEPTSVGKTLYKYETEDGQSIILSLYVDNGTCCTNSKPLYQQFIKDLSDKYQLSDQGALHWHLGMKFTRDEHTGSITIDQRAYIKNMLKRFNMADCKALSHESSIHHLYQMSNSARATARLSPTLMTTRCTSSSLVLSCTLLEAQGLTLLTLPQSAPGHSSCPTQDQCTLLHLSTSSATSVLKGTQDNDLPHILSPGSQQSQHN